MEGCFMEGVGQEIIFKSSIPADSLKVPSLPVREVSNSNFKLPETSWGETVGWIETDGWNESVGVIPVG